MGVKNSDWLSIDQSLHRVIDQLSQCTVRFAWFRIHILHILTILTYISLEKAMAPHSSTLAWKIPWAEEPGRLQSMGLLRVGHDWVTSLSLFTFIHWRRKWQPTPVFLPGESQDRGAWWAAVYGVTQSRTQLKRLSSSSSYICYLDCILPKSRAGIWIKVNVCVCYPLY